MSHPFETKHNLIEFIEEGLQGILKEELNTQETQEVETLESNAYHGNLERLQRIEHTLAADGTLLEIPEQSSYDYAPLDLSPIDDKRSIKHIAEAMHQFLTVLSTQLAHAQTANAAELNQAEALDHPNLDLDLQPLIEANVPNDAHLGLEDQPLHDEPNPDDNQEELFNDPLMDVAGEEEPLNAPQNHLEGAINPEPINNPVVQPEAAVETVVEEATESHTPSAPVSSTDTAAKTALELNQLQQEKVKAEYNDILSTQKGLLEKFSNFIFAPLKWIEGDSIENHHVKIKAKLDPLLDTVKALRRADDRLIAETEKLKAITDSHDEVVSQRQNIEILIAEKEAAEQDGAQDEIVQLKVQSAALEAQQFALFSKLETQKAFHFQFMIQKENLEQSVKAEAPKRDALEKLYELAVNFNYLKHEQSILESAIAQSEDALALEQPTTVMEPLRLDQSPSFDPLMTMDEPVLFSPNPVVTFPMALGPFASEIMEIQEQQQIVNATVQQLTKRLHDLALTKETVGQLKEQNTTKQSELLSDIEDMQAAIQTVYDKLVHNETSNIELLQIKSELIQELETNVKAFLEVNGGYLVGIHSLEGILQEPHAIAAAKAQIEEMLTEFRAFTQEHRDRGAQVLALKDQIIQNEANGIQLKESLQDAEVNLAEAEASGDLSQYQAAQKALLDLKIMLEKNTASTSEYEEALSTVNNLLVEDEAQLYDFQEIASKADIGYQKLGALELIQETCARLNHELEETNSVFMQNTEIDSTLNEQLDSYKAELHSTKLALEKTQAAFEKLLADENLIDSASQETQIELAANEAEYLHLEKESDVLHATQEAATVESTQSLHTHDLFVADESVLSNLGHADHSSFVPEYQDVTPYVTPSLHLDDSLHHESVSYL